MTGNWKTSDRLSAVKWNPAAHSVRDRRYKLIQRKAEEPALLFDLEADPSEKNDIAAAQPERVEQLAAQLAARQKALPSPVAAAPVASPLSEDVRERLRGLGYLEKEETP